MRILEFLKNNYLLVASLLLLIIGILSSAHVILLLIILIVYIVYLILERIKILNSIDTSLFPVAMFVLYLVMIVVVQSIVRIKFNIETQQELIAFIDVITFVFFVYLPVIVLYSKKKNILNHQRIIIYLTVFIYVSFGVFGLNSLALNDLDYLWTIVILENLIFLIFHETRIENPKKIQKQSELQDLNRK